MKKTFYLSLFVIVIIGCNKSDSLNLYEGGFAKRGLVMSELEVMTDEIASEVADVPDQDFVPVDRKVIKNGFLEIKSEDINRSRQRIDSLTKKYDCYMSSETFNESYNRWTYSFTIRIVSKAFDEFLDEIVIGPDIIKSKSVNAQDVTEQYYDLAARLETNREVEKRYKELLGRAQNIKEILEIERSLGEIRAEIESQQGRLNRMQNQIAYSTINISLFQDKTLKQTTVTRDSFSTRLAKSLLNGWNGFISFMIGLLTLWPFWIILIIAWKLTTYLRKKRKG